MSAPSKNPPESIRISMPEKARPFVVSWASSESVAITTPKPKAKARTKYDLPSFGCLIKLLMANVDVSPLVVNRRKCPNSFRLNPAKAGKLSLVMVSFATELITSAAALENPSDSLVETSPFKNPFTKIKILKKI